MLAGVSPSSLAASPKPQYSKTFLRNRGELSLPHTTSIMHDSWMALIFKINSHLLNIHKQT